MTFFGEKIKIKRKNMNTYAKYCPNVFCAKCAEEHQKGEIIILTTKYGKENECVVHNLLAKKDGFFYYSIVRADGFDSRERAKRKADKYKQASNNSAAKSDVYYDRSNKDRDFLSLGEPIKIGHHSEKRHRKIIEQANNNTRKSIEMDNKSKEQIRKSDFWEDKSKEINLSMPESIDFFEKKLKKAKERHEFLKNNPSERSHSFELTYAKKAVNETEKNLKIAVKLWG